MSWSRLIFVGLVIGVAFLLFYRPRQRITLREPGEGTRDLTMVTLLPRDAIPAIDDPQFLTAAEAEREYAANEVVLGVHIEGDARAYSVDLLDSHEIVNDTVNGKPIAVTW